MKRQSKMLLKNNLDVYAVCVTDPDLNSLTKFLFLRRQKKWRKTQLNSVLKHIHQFIWWLLATNDDDFGPGEKKDKRSLFVFPLLSIRYRVTACMNIIC